MKRQTLILTIAALTTAVLYAPQPLLPLFSQEFDVRSSSSALLVSLTLAPLAIAPLCYGFVLESLSSVKIIRFSVLLLAISEFAFAFCWNFYGLLIIRIIQGLTIPAILTSLMTNISVNTPKHRLQRVMSFYVAATITGGFLGRLSSGVLTIFWGWRPFFVFLGMALVICLSYANTMAEHDPTSAQKPMIRNLWYTVLDKRYQRPFTVAFCSFFVLASVMNFIPFRLVQIDNHVSELLFGFIYSGYLAGVFSSLMASRIKIFFKSDENAIIAGTVALAISIVLLLSSSITIVLLTLFLLSAAMFFVHTIAANMVNHLANRNKGIVNGLYVSFYYTGGTIGSFAPGLIYELYGWFLYITFLICIVFLGLYSAYMMKIAATVDSCD